MTYIGKKIIPALACTLLLSLLFLAASFINIASAKEIEETADMRLNFDRIVTGEMNDYSEKWIIVDNIRYRLCKGVKIFTPRNKLIPVRDIDAAEEVTLFRNRGCVRKIKVIRFAQ